MAPTWWNEVNHPFRTTVLRSPRRRQAAPAKKQHRLKQALRNNQNVTWLKRDIASYITIPDQVSEVHCVSGLNAIDGANDEAVVPRGIPGEPADRDHRVQHRHICTIGKRARLRCFAYDAHLVRDRTDEARHDNRDERLPDVFAEPLLVFACEGSRCLADRDDILDEWYRNAAVRPHRYRDCQLGVAPDEDIQIVPGTDAVLGRWQRGC